MFEMKCLKKILLEMAIVYPTKIFPVPFTYIAILLLLYNKIIFKLLSESKEAW
jgi:hypothetical protein